MFTVAKKKDKHYPLKNYRVVYVLIKQVDVIYIELG